MFTVKMFSGKEVREEVFYDITKAMVFFNSLSTLDTVNHARLISHRRIIAEY